MMLALFFLGLAQPRLFRNPSAREHGVGALVGLAFFLGFALQVWGLARTTPALSAFITSLGSAWVPLLAWIFLRLPVSSITLLGLLVGVGGTAVLGIDVSKGWQLGGGEGRTLMASILFAVQILLLDRFGRRVRSNHLTVGFLGITGGLALVGNLVLAGFGPGLGSWLAWLGDMLCQPIVLCDLLLLTLLSTVLAFHLMNVYQPQVSAGRAALVYLLEPVFASVFSIVWGHDPLTWRLLVGGCLILGGNLLIEVPFWTQPKPPKTWAPNRPDAEK
jgi:drug/metabolite transporter (DMT)-like permease